MAEGGTGTSRELIDAGRVEKRLFINDELGLHARPAARIALTAQQFESRITLKHENMVVDAKSILDILTLAAQQGSCVVLRCEGMDADNAASALTSLFEGCDTLES